jgi:hypothetical protein
MDFTINFATTQYELAVTVAVAHVQETAERNHA